MSDSTPSTRSDGDRVPAPFGPRRYVPVVLTRRGERAALSDSTDEVKRGLTPLFQLHAAPVDPESGTAKKTARDHLTEVGTALTKTWGDSPAFVDAGDIPEVTIDGQLPIEWFIRLCDSRGLRLAPTLNTSSSERHIEACLSVAADLGLALAFRLLPTEWARISTPNGKAALTQLLGRVGGDPRQVHLIFDLQGQITDPPDITGAAIRGALANLDALYDWRSITVCGTSMPQTTASVGAGNASELPRLEWQLWRQLGDLPRRPSYGDYGVSSSDVLATFDPITMQSAAQLRYTLSTTWLIARGRGLRNAGFAQMYEIARTVRSHPGYSGREFSRGDQWISDCAARAVTPGNQELWKRMTTNHHLAFVVRQIANLLGT